MHSTGRLGDLFTTDTGKGDLGKVQVMMWSLLAAGLFIIQFHNRVVEMPSSMLQIPDVDPSLLALVGLGQGAYLVKKVLVDDPQPTPQAEAVKIAEDTAKINSAKTSAVVAVTKTEVVNDQGKVIDAQPAGAGR